MKKCTKCNKIKELNQFYILRRSKDNHRSICKHCSKKYQVSNVKKIKEYLRIYYIKNKKRLLEYRKNYRMKNQKEVLKYNLAYRKNRRKTDINCRLVDCLRKRIWEVLKGYPKSARTIELIGCTSEFLKQYLTLKFTEGMTLENYGKWHIDHIKPCARFDLSKPSEQRKCFHYTNLQPLWAKENLIKNKY